MSPPKPITLGIHMLAKDASHCIERALASVGNLFVEFVLIDDSSTDGTVDIARRFCAERLIPFQVVQISPETHPQLYLHDVAETFQPLEGHALPFPFSGKKLLCDFGSARNLGWDRASTDWILWLDADDVVQNSEAIPSSIMMAEAKNIPQVYAHYNDQVRASFTKRGAARWLGCVHESLSALPESALSPVVIKDLQDSHRERIPGHYLKAAWLACQRAGLEQADVNDIASIVQDLFWVKSHAWKPLFEVLRRRAPDSRVLTFVEKAVSS